MSGKVHTYLLFVLAVLFVVAFLYPVWKGLLVTVLNRVGATGAAAYVDAG